MLKVTALGSSTQSAAGAASGVASYLLGPAEDQERATAQLLSPVAGTEQQGRYYADSIEGPGQWIGHGAARLELQGVVNREAFERVLSGRDPATGARLLTARGSAGRTSLKVGNHTRTGPGGEVLYGVEDTASALGLRPEDVEVLIANGRDREGSERLDNEALQAIDIAGEAFVTDAELVRWETANRALATGDHLRSDGRPSDLLSMNEAAARIGVSAEYLRRVANRTVDMRSEIDAALAEGRTPERDWLDTVTIAEATPAPPAFEPPFDLAGAPFDATEAAGHLGLAQTRSIYRLFHSGAINAERQAVERPGREPGHKWIVGRAELASYLSDRHDQAHRTPPSTSKRRFVTREALAQFLDRREPPAVRVGFDLTFTVQKSVSVLGLLTDGDHQDTVVEAFDAANAVAIDWLEHNAAFTRRNGKRVPTEGLVVGSFLHGTSRALDPFLHRHNIVANAAIDRNGDHKALDSTALWRQSHPADALATAELRYRLSAELGVRWVRSPRGTWEVDGIGEAVIMEFSTRRREILEALNEVNDGTTADAHGRDMAAVRTRGDKQPSTRDELVAGWRDRAAAHGLDARALDRCTGRNVTLHDQLDLDQQAELRDWLEGEHGVTAEHSTFSRRDVIIAIADYPGPDGKGLLMPAAEIIRQTDDWLASVQVASIEADGTARTSDRISRRDGRTVRTTAHEPVFTTVAALRRQEKLLALYHAAPDGRGQVDAGTVAAALLGHDTISDEQAAMVTAFTRSGRPVQAGIGLAGAGKTFTMRVAAQVWTDAGYRVIGTTLAGQAAQVLAAEAGIDAETVAMLLTKWRATGDNPLDARTVLIVDEAATIDDRSFLALLTMADEAGAAVRCIGDPGQHQAVAAGGAFRVMAEDPSSPTLFTSRRVIHDGDRHAADLLRAGRPSEALNVLADHGHLFETSDENDAYRLALAMWWQNRADGAAPLVERTNAVREELNRGARRLRQNAGEVAVDREVTAAGGRAFSVGDEVVARVGDRTLHGDRPEDYVANGTAGEVVAVDPEADTITVDFGDRGTHQLEREYFDARPRQPDGKTIAGLDLRYAITSHGVQGATFDRIVSILRGGATMAEAYVNITRGRHANEVITVAPSPYADTEAFLPTVENRRTGRDAVESSLARDEPDEMALSIDPLASAVAVLRSTRSLPDLQQDLDRSGDEAPAELRRAVADLTAAAARAVVADPNPELVAAFGPRPDVPWMRDQWEAAIRDIAGFRAARPQPAGDGPWAWALGTPPATEPAAEHRRTVIEALGDTVTTLTLRRLADRTVRPGTAELTPLHQMTATTEVPRPQVTPADVTAATRAASHTAQRVRDARQHLETVQDRRAPGLRRNRSQLADAREALVQAEAAHQAARTHREHTKARELEARLDARRHTQGLPSGPQAQARAETVRHHALTDPPPWLRAAITAAAAAGAGTVLASEDFTRWAGDVAVYRDLRNIDPADEHPIGHRPPDGPLATEHDRLRRQAPTPLSAAARAAAAEPSQAQVPA